jgi:hypothetical protein
MHRNYQQFFEPPENQKGTLIKASEPSFLVFRILFQG